MVPFWRWFCACAFGLVLRGAIFPPTPNFSFFLYQLISWGFLGFFFFWGVFPIFGIFGTQRQIPTKKTDVMRNQRGSPYAQRIRGAIGVDAQGVIPHESDKKVDQHGCSYSRLEWGGGGRVGGRVCGRGGVLKYPPYVGILRMMTFRAAGN